MRKRLAGTIGLCLSISGFKKSVVKNMQIGQRSEVLLLDRNHFEALVYQFIDVKTFFDSILDYAHFDANPYSKITSLTTRNKLSEVYFDWEPVYPYFEKVNGKFRITPILTGLKIRGLSGIDSDNVFVFSKGDTLKVDRRKKKVSHFSSIPYITNVLLDRKGYFFATDRSLGKVEGATLRHIKSPDSVPSRLIPLENKGKFLMFCPDIQGKAQIVEIDKENWSEREIELAPRMHDICAIPGREEIFSVDPNLSVVRAHSSANDLLWELELEKGGNLKIAQFSSKSLVVCNGTKLYEVNIDEPSASLIVQFKGQIGHKFGEIANSTGLYFSIFGPNFDTLFFLEKNS